MIDDVAQDVWIVLIRKLPRWVFDPGLGSIAAWVTKIAHRWRLNVAATLGNRRPIEENAEGDASGRSGAGAQRRA